MFRLGITGGIGSGKSTVCSIFSQLGIPVYNADSRAKILVSELPELQENIKKVFGEQSFDGGVYNRQYIASIVFSNREKLNLLNGIIHPFVLQDWANFCDENQSSPYIVKEAAIMFETESRNSVDSIILVYAPIELRIQRIMQRDGVTEAQIRSRIASQMPEEDKIKLADDVIYNDGKHVLIDQVMAIHKKLVTLK